MARRFAHVLALGEPSQAAVACALDLQPQQMTALLRGDAPLDTCYLTMIGGHESVRAVIECVIDRMPVGHQRAVLDELSGRFPTCGCGCCAGSEVAAKRARAPVGDMALLEDW